MLNIPLGKRSVHLLLLSSMRTLFTIWENAKSIFKDYICFRMLVLFKFHECITHLQIKIALACVWPSFFFSWLFGKKVHGKRYRKNQMITVGGQTSELFKWLLRKMP
ncbi:hypothetical protein U1Q18_052387 [Sarracenia purpurea var. burkii]